MRFFKTKASSAGAQRWKTLRPQETCIRDNLRSLHPAGPPPAPPWVFVIPHPPTPTAEVLNPQPRAKRGLGNSGSSQLGKKPDHDGRGEARRATTLPFPRRPGGPTAMEVKNPPPAPLWLIAAAIFNQHRLQKVGKKNR